MQAALQRYEAACGGAPERLVSGSDDFTMFLWEPSISKKPLQRLTGHMQLINQVNPCCCSGLLPQKALNMGTEDIRVIIRTTRSCPAREPGTPRLLQAAALPGSHYDH